MATIHLRDLFADGDPTITPYNHLRYSPEFWNRWACSSLMSYNRLKAPDYRDLLQEAGFRNLVFEVESGDIRQLAQVRVHPSFASYSSEELARGTFSFVCKNLDHHPHLPRRISRGQAHEASHYDVTEKLLHQHLKVLADASMVPVDPEKLRDPTRLGSASYFASFDDGTAEHAVVTAPLLESAGVRGIFFVPTQRLDRAGYLTSEDVRRMHGAGHVFGLHGHQHRRLDRLSEAALEEDFLSSRKILREITSQDPWIFAPVGGYCSSRLIEVAKHHGVAAIRTMRWG